MTNAETDEAIMVGDVRVLVPPLDEMKAMGKLRGLFLSLGGVETRLNEFMRSNSYHWRLRLSDIPVPRLPNVADWPVFMGLTAIRKGHALDLNAVAEALAPYEELLKHHLIEWHEGRPHPCPKADEMHSRMHADFNAASDSIAPPTL